MQRYIHNANVNQIWIPLFHVKSIYALAPRGARKLSVSFLFSMLVGRENHQSMPEKKIYNKMLKVQHLCLSGSPQIIFGVDISWVSLIANGFFFSAIDYLWDMEHVLPCLHACQTMSVILRFYFMIITIIVITIIELRYYTCVHNKMRVDNFVVLQNK